MAAKREDTPEKLPTQREAALLAGQKRVLERIATGAPLGDTLAELTRFIEAQEPGLTCGILIVGSDGAHFARSIGPRLPATYHQTLTGAPITPPYLGACGEATHTDRVVTVPDVADDERWHNDWRKLVLSSGLKAMRSTPVRGAGGRVLASFAMYYDHPRNPNPTQPGLIEIATHLAGIAIERDRERAELEDQNERLASVFESTAVGIAAMTPEARFVRVNDAFCTLTGYPAEELIGMSCLALIHPEDRAQLLPLVDDLLAGRRSSFSIEKRCFRKNGTTVWIRNSMSLTRDAAGEPLQLIALCQDVTGQRSIEKALRASEERLATELKAAQWLQQTSLALINENEPEALYRDLLEAVIAITRADAGKLQRLDRGRGELRLLAAKGFHPESEKFWERVRTNLPSPGGTALATGERAIAEDVETCDYLTDTSHLEEYRRSGIRAVQSTPLMSRSGRMLGMISTHWRQPHRPEARELRLLDVLARQAAGLIERSETEDWLRAQARRLKALNRVARLLSRNLDLERIADAITDSATALSGAKFGAFFYNAAEDGENERYDLVALAGASRAVFEELGPPLSSPLFAITFRGESVVRSEDIREDPRYGRKAPHFGLPAGHPVVVSYLAVPVFARSGEVLGGLFFGHDEPDMFDEEDEALIVGIAAHAALAIENARLLDAARNGEEQRTLLLHELSHRVKNTLATVQSVAMQTFGSATSPEAFQGLFSARLAALARTHELLTASDWQGVALAELANRELVPYGQYSSGRWRIRGKKVWLDARTALPLGMALHELATNAAKYGALSTPTGSVELRWKIRGEGDEAQLLITWAEHGGPPVATPVRRGFGSRVIERGLKHELAATARLEFAPDGLRCIIELPFPVADIKHTATTAAA